MVVDISLGLWSWYSFIQSILIIFQLVSLLMIFQQTCNKTYPSLVLSITTWIRGNDAEPPLMWYLFTHPHTTLSNRTSSSRLSHIKSHWAVGCSDTYVMWKAEWKLKTSFSPEKMLISQEPIWLLASAVHMVQREWQIEFTIVISNNELSRQTEQQICDSLVY